MTAPIAARASRANQCTCQDRTNDGRVHGDLDAERKAFQSLRASLALEGHALSRTDRSDGPCSYFVTRWGMVRELRDLHAVRRFAAQVGASHD